MENLKLNDIKVENLSLETDYVTGSIKAVIDDKTYNLSFDYKIIDECVDLHTYSNPGWFTGSCYETPLPKEVEYFGAEISDVAENAARNYLGEQRADERF